jgi:hypothetical protein
MPRQKQEFFDTFRHKGIWWLPETPENTVQGVLNHEEDETTLDLFGGLRNIDMRTAGVLGTPTPTPIIFGELESGEPCTLYKNFSRSEKLPMFGGKSTSSTWVSNFLFIGAHVQDPATFAFQDWRVAYTGLEEWMADRPFKPPEYKFEEKKVVEVQGGYINPEKFEVSLPKLGGKLGSKYLIMTK